MSWSFSYLVKKSGFFVCFKKISGIVYGYQHTVGTLCKCTWLNLYHKIDYYFCVYSFIKYTQNSFWKIIVQDFLFFILLKLWLEV